MKRSFTKIALILFIIIGNIGCDQVTKEFAKNNLKNEDEISYCDRAFVLTYAENPGAFMGNGADWQEPFKSLVLVILPVLALSFLFIYTIFSKVMSLGQAIGFSFILGGGISNIYDRIVFGKVVDFLNMGFYDIRTGIFNIADVAIMTGLCILIWKFLFRK